MPLGEAARAFPTPTTAIQNLRGAAPDKRERGDAGKGGSCLSDVAMNFPTPVVGDAHLSSSPEAAARRLAEGKDTLSRVVEGGNWSTPTAEDSQAHGARPGDGGDPLNAVVENWQTPTVAASKGVPYQNDNHDATKPRATLVGQGEQWQTPMKAAGDGGHASRGGDRKDEPYLAGQAQQWRTPSVEEVGPREETLFAADGGPPKPGERVYRRTPDGRLVNTQQTLGLQVEKMWNTPVTAPDAKNLNSNKVSGPASLGGQADAWATPQARDEKGVGPEHSKGGRDLPKDAALFPTPTGMDGNRAGAAEDGEEWRRRRKEKAKEGINLHYYLNASVDDFMRRTDPCHCGAPKDGLGYPLCKKPLPGEDSSAYWARMEEHDRRWGRATGGTVFFPTTKTPSGGAESRESRESRGSGGQDLEAAVTKEGAWATPRASDEKSGEVSEAIYQKNSRPLTEQATRFPTPVLQDSEQVEVGSRETLTEMVVGSHASSPAAPAPPTGSGGDRSWPLGLTSLPPSWVRSLLRGKPPADLLERGRACAADPSTVVDASTAIGSLCCSVRRSLRRSRLNPRFVEWLQGWPMGWTELGSIGSTAFASWETESSRLLRLLRSRFSTTGSSGVSPALLAAREFRKKSSAARQLPLFAKEASCPLCGQATAWVPAGTPCGTPRNDGTPCPGILEAAS